MNNPKEAVTLKGQVPDETEGTGARPESQNDESASATPSKAPEEPGAMNQKPEQEKQELYDRLLRKQAELDNFRKRVQREKEEFHQHATSELIRALLPVLDGFERALHHQDASSPDQFQKGVELIYQEMLGTLARAGVSPIETTGKTFDPRLHQAVEAVEAPGHRDQEIVEELQRGYQLKGRLLRPAIVKVAIAPKKH
jgi:molecular chaperone GrpE